MESVSRINGSRNRRLVEGALLADVAVVLLLGRVYLPIPVLRTLWRLLAGAPFVLLTLRHGVRTTIMAGLVAYLLLSALVGPVLALPALDTAFAAILVAVGIRLRAPKPVTAFLGGVIYAAADIVGPAIAFMLLLRIPASVVVGEFRNGLNGAVKVLVEALRLANRFLAFLPPTRGIHLPVRLARNTTHHWALVFIDHWLWFLLGAAVVYAIANVYAYALVADMVLDRLHRKDNPTEAAA